MIMVLQQQWRHAIRRYALFQLPGLGALILLLLVLKNWIDLPGWALWGSPAAWIAKDILIFPFVWRAYLPPQSEDNRLIGETGISRQKLDPSGYIFVRGELWRAELEKGKSAQPVEEGESVEVIGKHRLTLVVRRKHRGLG
jgi:membrane-bound ClpP family serine protease